MKKILALALVTVFVVACADNPVEPSESVEVMYSRHGQAPADTMVAGDSASTADSGYAIAN